MKKPGTKKPRWKSLEEEKLKWWWKEIPNRRRIYVPPSSKKVKLTITVDEDLYQELFQKAEQYQFSGSQVVSAAMRFCFKGDLSIWLPMGPHEARRLAFQMKREGLSLGDIAANLNRFRIYTKQCDRWTTSGVHRLLHPRPIES